MNTPRKTAARKSTVAKTVVAKADNAVDTVVGATEAERHQGQVPRCRRAGQGPLA
jgi:hypothetical protein